METVVAIKQAKTFGVTLIASSMLDKNANDIGWVEGRNIRRTSGPLKVVKIHPCSSDSFARRSFVAAKCLTIPRFLKSSLFAHF